MRLLPREADKLALHNAGFLAQKRLARGLRLNYTEAVALIAAQVSQDAAAPSTSAGLLVKTGYSVCVSLRMPARPQSQRGTDPADQCGRSVSVWIRHSAPSLERNNGAFLPSCCVHSGSGTDFS
jgi:hypothetical protein